MVSKQVLNVNFNEELDLFNKSKTRYSIRVCYEIYLNTKLTKEIILIICEYIYQFFGIVNDFQLPYSIKSSEEILHIKISPDGLIYILISGTLKICKFLNDKQEITQEQFNNSIVGYIIDSTFDQSVKCMTIYEDRIFIGFNNGGINVFKQCNTENTIKDWFKEYNLLDHTGSITSITKLNYYGYDGIISTSSDNSVRIWNLETGKCDFNSSYVEFPTCLTLLSQNDSLKIVIGLFNGNIEIWNFKRKDILENNFKYSSIIINSKDRYIVCINKISPQQFISCSIKSDPQICNINTFKYDFILRGHIDAIMNIDTLPNGYIISTSFDHHINIWSLPRTNSNSQQEIFPIHTISREFIPKNGSLTVLNNGQIAVITSISNKYVLTIIY